MYLSQTNLLVECIPKADKNGLGRPKLDSHNRHCDSNLEMPYPTSCPQICSPLMETNLVEITRQVFGKTVYLK